MPKSPKDQINLEDLLKLKRHESPDSDFWTQFEHDFEKRRLQALLSEEGEAEGSAWASWIRRALLGGTGLAGVTAAVALIAIQTGSLNLATLTIGPSAAEAQTTAVAAVDSAPVSTATPMARELTLASAPRVAQIESGVAEFVVDAFTSEPENRGFERIHANPVFTHIQTVGAQYVSDTFSQGDRSSASFAIDRAVARF